MESDSAASSYRFRVMRQGGPRLVARVGPPFFGPLENVRRNRRNTAAGRPATMWFPSLGLSACSSSPRPGFRSRRQGRKRFMDGDLSRGDRCRTAGVRHSGLSASATKQGLAAPTRLRCRRCGFSAHSHWSAPTNCPRCRRRGRRVRLIEREPRTPREGRGGLALGLSEPGSRLLDLARDALHRRDKQAVKRSTR